MKAIVDRVESFEFPYLARLPSCHDPLEEVMSGTAVTVASRRSGRRIAIVAGLLAAAVTVLPGPANAGAAACSGYVGLTYDDGPNNGTTPQLLNALRSAGVRATFFNIGTKVQQNPALARTQTNAGMWVANLTNRNLCAGMISPTTGRAVAPA